MPVGGQQPPSSGVGARLEWYHTLTGLVMATQISADFSRFCEIPFLLYLLLSLLEVDVSVKVI